MGAETWMARKSSYCKSGNKNINWHPTQVFLEDFWAIIFQKICLNISRAGTTALQILESPRTKCFFVYLGAKPVQSKDLKKKWMHSGEKKSGILSDMSACRRLPSSSRPKMNPLCPWCAQHVNALDCTGIGHPLCSPKTMCPKLGPTASSPKIVCEAACEMTGTAGTDTTGTTLPNHPRTNDSVWIC
jgi:hypothetical protein